ncbi:hypothetical protein GW17_00043326 [Ensete ventricosum]|nr:hypothetical protein GW17_00043326 [Ensete ventricosum]
MDRSRALRVLMLLWLIPGLTYAGDIVHEDDKAPKLPGCSNHFILVKVQTWINNEEDSEFVGVGARFGTTIQTKEKYTSRTPLSLSDPSDCCTAPKEKVCYSVIIEVVHTCFCKSFCCLYVSFCAELYKMVCERNETDLDINIPAVMLPHDAGVSLERNLKSGASRPTNMLGGYVITVPQDIRATFLHSTNYHMIDIVGSNVLEKLSSKFPSLELSRILHWLSLHFVLLLPYFGLCTDVYLLPGLAKMCWYFWRFFSLMVHLGRARYTGKNRN